MRNKNERTDNSSQAIRSLDKHRLSCLLDYIAKNPNKYPGNPTGWLVWLDADSGDSIVEF